MLPHLTCNTSNDRIWHAASNRGWVTCAQIFRRFRCVSVGSFAVHAATTLFLRDPPGLPLSGSHASERASPPSYWSGCTTDRGHCLVWNGFPTSLMRYLVAPHQP